MALKGGASPCLDPLNVHRHRDPGFSGAPTKAREREGTLTGVVPLPSPREPAALTLTEPSSGVYPATCFACF